jgi:molybdate transport system substrate-binding protein
VKVAAGLAALALAGCSTPGTEGVTVFAASSLKAPFGELAHIYQREHPEDRVILNFAGSADLVAQLDQGAPAAVLATADEATMDKAAAGRVLAPTAFATNSMTIVVPKGNPGGVRGLSDLANEDLNVVVCAPQVPCGASTTAIERAAGVQITPDSQESAVADVLGKVTSGQADAGVVYVSDAFNTPGHVEEIQIPDNVNMTNLYLIAPVTGGGQAFVDLVLSDAGQQVLADNGFGPP